MHLSVGCRKKQGSGSAFHGLFTHFLSFCLHLAENRGSRRCVCRKQAEQGQDVPQRDEEIPEPGHLSADYNGPSELQDVRQLGGPAVRDGGPHWGRKHPPSVQRCVVCDTTGMKVSRLRLFRETEQEECGFRMNVACTRALVGPQNDSPGPEHTLPYADLSPVSQVCTSLFAHITRNGLTRGASSWLGAAVGSSPITRSPRPRTRRWCSAEVGKSASTCGMWGRVASGLCVPVGGHASGTLSSSCGASSASSSTSQLNTQLLNHGGRHLTPRPPTDPHTGKTARLWCFLCPWGRELL